MILLLFSNKKCTLVFADIILFLFVLILSAYFADIAKSKTYEFSVKSLTNRSKWTKFLKGTAKKRWQTMRNISKFDSKFNPLPKISKIFPSRLLKPDSKHNPCVVAKTNCLNGGLCMSVGNEWYCDCPKSHYGQFCEFAADQTHCKENLCRNNATCYSTEHFRQVSNPDVAEVKKCSQRKMQDNKNNETCLFNLNVKYMCWCKFGYEGAFCEFSEGMRCCAEDFCNNHGLIDYTEFFVKKKGKFDKKINKYKFTPQCDQAVCKCICEEFYSKEDNCSTVDPCRDLECINGGKCLSQGNSTYKIASCHCPKSGDFIAPTEGIQIFGERCEDVNITEEEIDLDQRKCIPCGPTGFNDYINCLNKAFRSRVDFSNFFAKECFDNGERKTCKIALRKGFCLNSGKCRASVSNISELVTGKKFYETLFLVPKCECPPNYEGDFCENFIIDECDRRDIVEHKAYLDDVGRDNVNEELLKFEEESLFKIVKNRLGWKPKYYGTIKNADLKGLEKAFRDRGMKTYCGFHGFCRPYNEEQGMSCKCDNGYKGPRCELLDPCVPNPCKEDETCIEFPIADDSVEESELTYVCNS